MNKRERSERAELVAKVAILEALLALPDDDSRRRVVLAASILSRS